MQRILLALTVLLGLLIARPIHSFAAVGDSDSSRRDGSHDFDFNIGHWHTHIRRLTNPFKESPNWIVLDGTVAVRKVWGELYDQETYNGRSILVRGVWSNITPDSHAFEISFSDDGGRSWVSVFIADLTRDNSAPQEK